MDAHEVRMVGALLRKIRFDRGLSQEVVAGRAGITAGFLSRVERGEAPLERLSHWRGIADALGIALSEILRLPVPTPGNGHTDSSVVAVRRALDEVVLGRPRGAVLPTETLRARVVAIQDDNRACRFPKVASALPGLIRDLHSTLVVGRELDILLPLAVLLHVDVTRVWLVCAAAPIDFRRQVVYLAQGLARQHNTVTTLGIATFGVVDTLMADGAFELARAELTVVPVPETTIETVGLICATMTTHALLAAIDGDDPETPLREAAEIAERYGEIGVAGPLGFGFGPTKVATRRIITALELDDADRAINIARTVHPERSPLRHSQARCWMETGRALAGAPGHEGEAVLAFRRAEDLFPVRVYRDPRTREVLGGLITRAPRNAELLRLADRAGLFDR